MANLYLSDAYLTDAQLKVVFAQDLENGLTAFALADNIGRPEGGGQPSDRCSFIHHDVQYDVRRLYKQSSKPFYALYEYSPGHNPPVKAGDEITFNVDKERRMRLSRNHTLTHVVMSAIRQCVADYKSRGAEMLEDERSAYLWFQSSSIPSELHVNQIAGVAKAAIARSLPVRPVTEPSIEIAEGKYSAWRVDSTLGLKGKVRIIVIGSGCDANPCSGTHVRSTSEIGDFDIDRVVWNTERACRPSSTMRRMSHRKLSSQTRMQRAMPVTIPRRIWWFCLSQQRATGDATGPTRARAVRIGNDSRALKNVIVAERGSSRPTPTSRDTP